MAESVGSTESVIGTVTPTRVGPTDPLLSGVAFMDDATVTDDEWHRASFHSH